MIEKTSFISGNPASLESGKQPNHKKSNETIVSFKKLKVHIQQKDRYKYILLTKSKVVGDTLETKSCGATCSILPLPELYAFGILSGLIALSLSIFIINQMFDKSEITLKRYLMPPVIGVITSVFVTSSLLCLKKLTSVKTSTSSASNTFIS